MYRTTQKSFQRSETLNALVFIIPSFLGFFIFVLGPVLFSLILSFTRWSFISGFSGIKFIGLKNFTTFFNDPVFIASFFNNFLFTFMTVPTGIVIALVLAVLINDYAYCSGALKAAFFMPYISSIVAISIVWSVILHPIYGPVNQFLNAVGVQNPPGWFTDLKWALPSISMLSVWRILGYNILIYLAGLSTISPEMYEAAHMDGCSRIQAFFKITIPMVSPTTFLLFMMNMIGSFKVFDQIQVITEGGPGNATTVLAYYIYKNAFLFQRMGYASAIALCMFIIIFALTFLQRKMQKEVVY